MVEYLANESLGAVLSAVSDATRRSILNRLSGGPARVSDIAAQYPISLNAISKHIKVLEGAGLVRRTQRGRDHVLALNAKPLREVARWALSYEQYWDEKLDALESYFASRRLGK
jgi:DNA-binding transcriptional ArsR family regulator